MSELISRQAAIDAAMDYNSIINAMDSVKDGDIRRTKRAISRILAGLPSAEPQYEELTPEEAASEIASGSIMSAWYWLDAMVRLRQMGYAICRKK